MTFIIIQNDAQSTIVSILNQVIHSLTHSLSVNHIIQFILISFKSSSLTWLYVCNDITIPGTRKGKQQQQQQKKIKKKLKLQRLKKMNIKKKEKKMKEKKSRTNRMDEKKN